MPAKKKQAPMVEDSESEGSDDGGMMMGGGNLAKFLNKNYSREFMAKLPSQIRDRTRLLITMDDTYLEAQTAHQNRVFELRSKYEKLYQPLFARRREIVTGDGPLATDEEIEAGYPNDHKETVTIAVTADDGEDTIKGLPMFWVDALRHHVILDEMITERDTEVLAFLIDIQGATLENGVTVIFTFAPNDFMKGTTASKTIYIKKEFGEDAIDHTDESTIEWNDGKNPTVEVITQKQKNKKKQGAVRYVSKTEPCESFFNLFSHHDEREEAEQWCSLLMTIHEKVAPNAVEYVTGEAHDGSSDIEDDDMYGDEDDDEDDDESEDEDVPHHHRGGGGGGGRGGRASSSRGGMSAPAPAPPGKDCKTQ